MQEISNFLVAHYKTIIGLVLCAISLIISIFRKRPSASSVLDYVFRIISNELPFFILQAEKKFSDGEEKLSYVVTHCMLELKKYVVLDNNSSDKARVCFVSACESILRTPQKK